MKRNTEPWWLKLAPIFGAEDDDKEDESKEDEESEESEEDEDGDKKPDNANLLSALRKERKRNRELEKEAKALRKFKDDADAKDKSDADKAKKEAEDATAKSERLAVRVKDQAIDNLITKLAVKYKFRDVDDALKLVDRSDIEVDQDEDDPSEVEVDEKSVEKALKKLSEAKPHLVGSDTSGDPTGSKFGGPKKGNRTDKEAEEEKLVGLYPALRMGRKSTS